MLNRPFLECLMAAPNPKLVTPIDVRYRRVYGHAGEPGARRITMQHANDGVVLTVEDFEDGKWGVLGTFELFADEIPAFTTRLLAVANNEDPSSSQRNR